MDEKNTWKLVGDNTKKSISYEHCDTLIDIFLNLDSGMKKHFVQIMSDYITLQPESVDRSSASLAFYTLIRLNFIDEAILALSKRKDSSVSILKLIKDIIMEDYSYFNVKELSKLLFTVKKLSTGIYQVGDEYQSFIISKITSQGYELLKKDIKGINIEINRDKEQVQEIINYLDFDNKYNILLTEIDKFINTDDEILSSGMISNLRSFMQDILTDLARKIASLESEDIPKYENLGNMGRIRKYLKIKLELSDNDNSLIDSFINILHAEGGHSFVSNKDYFRLSRNIAIEIILLLLSKYKSKYA